MPKVLLRGESIGKAYGILLDKDGTVLNSENRLLFLAQSRLIEAKILFDDIKQSPKSIALMEDLLIKLYGLKRRSINPNSCMAIASRKDNLISTAALFCILGNSWPTSLNMAEEVFKNADSKFHQNYRKENKYELINGVKSFIKRCHKENISLGIISNDSRKEIKEFINKNQLEDYFPFFWSSEDSPPKPNPKSVKELCRLMQLSPSQCVLIGDADTDMSMARKSGVSIAIGFTAGWKEPPILYEHHYLLNDWNELRFQAGG